MDILLFSRTVSRLFLVQVLCLILGFFAVGIVLKMHGYPDNPTVRWESWAVFLRQYGFAVLILPVAWLGYAKWAGPDKHDGLPIALGIVLAAAIMVAFGVAAMFPFYRPLTLFVGPR